MKIILAVILMASPLVFAKGKEKTVRKPTNEGYASGVLLTCKSTQNPKAEQKYQQLTEDVKGNYTAAIDDLKINLLAKEPQSEIQMEIISRQGTFKVIGFSVIRFIHGSIDCMAHW